MPGVPPDAADQVKRLFKGLFGRGKKSKDENASTTSSSATVPTQTQDPTPTTTGSAPAPAPVPSSSDTAPQIPQIQSPGALNTGSDTFTDRPAAASAKVTPTTEATTTHTPVPAAPTPASTPAPTQTQAATSENPSGSASVPAETPAPTTTATESSPAETDIPTTAGTTQSPAYTEPPQPQPQATGASSSIAAPEPQVSTTPAPTTTSPASATETKKVEGTKPLLVTMSEPEKQNSSGGQEVHEETKIDSAGPRENDESGNDTLKTLRPADAVQDEQDSTTKSPSPVPGMQATSGPLQDYYHQQ